MSNVYSLADLRAEIEQEFAPLELDLGRGKVVLRNVMRLGSTERQTVVDAVKKFSSDSENDDVEVLFEAIRTVLKTVADGGKGDSLVNLIGDDLALAMKIINLWTEATQPGEASNSPS